MNPDLVSLIEKCESLRELWTSLRFAGNERLFDNLAKLAQDAEKVQESTYYGRREVVQNLLSQVLLQRRSAPENLVKVVLQVVTNRARALDPIHADLIVSKTTELLERVKEDRESQRPWQTLLRDLSEANQLWWLSTLPPSGLESDPFVRRLTERLNDGWLSRSVSMESDGSAMKTIEATLICKTVKDADWWFKALMSQAVSILGRYKEASRPDWVVEKLRQWADMAHTSQSLRICIIDDSICQANVVLLDPLFRPDTKGYHFYPRNQFSGHDPLFLKMPNAALDQWYEECLALEDRIDKSSLSIPDLCDRFLQLTYRSARK